MQRQIIKSDEDSEIQTLFIAKISKGIPSERMTALLKEFNVPSISSLNKAQKRQLIAKIEAF